MSPSELVLAVDRHATSKLPNDDLVDIRTLGFRGEALPSIGAVARMTITSRQDTGDEGNQIEVDGGQKGAVRPAAFRKGTRLRYVTFFMLHRQD